MPEARESRTEVLVARGFAHDVYGEVASVDHCPAVVLAALEVRRNGDGRVEGGELD